MKANQQEAEIDATGKEIEIWYGIVDVYGNWQRDCNGIVIYGQDRDWIRSRYDEKFGEVKAFDRSPTGYLWGVYDDSGKRWIRDCMGRVRLYPCYHAALVEAYGNGPAVRAFPIAAASTNNGAVPYHIYSAEGKKRTYPHPVLWTIRFGASGGYSPFVVGSREEAEAARSMSANPGDAVVGLAEVPL